MAAQLHPYKIAVIRSWEADADEALVKHVNQLRNDGLANWMWDPEVEHVLGLVPVATPNRALVIIYPDGDWEMAAELSNAVETGLIEAIVGDDDEAAPCLKGTPGCQHKHVDHDECEAY